MLLGTSRSLISFSFLSPNGSKQYTFKFYIPASMKITPSVLVYCCFSQIQVPRSYGTVSNTSPCRLISWIFNASNKYSFSLDEVIDLMRSRLSRPPTYEKASVPMSKLINLNCWALIKIWFYTFVAEMWWPDCGISGNSLQEFCTTS